MVHQAITAQATLPAGYGRTRTTAPTSAHSHTHKSPHVPARDGNRGKPGCQMPACTTAKRPRFTTRAKQEPCHSPRSCQAGVATGLRTRAYSACFISMIFA